MGALPLQLCNARSELPAVEVFACSPVAGDARRATSASELRCTAVAATLLSLLGLTVGVATAHQSFIDQPVILTGDAALRQFKQGKPADHAAPPQRGAPRITASRGNAV